MLKKINHVAIAVKDLEEGARFYQDVLGLMLTVILLVALLAQFVTFVMNFYINPVNNIKFILLLLGIILNIYVVVWLFEHKKLFD